jgi:hypothetical protein
MTNADRVKRGEAQSTGAAEPDWCDETGNAADTPLGELVEGLNAVAALAIPYARLPRRARTACAPDFMCWGDIAGQTIESLLSRPKIGERAVQALLTAATDAVARYRAAAVAERVGADAAVRRLVGDLDEFDHELLARLWAAEPEPQRALAARLGINIASVYRNQPRAQARLAELLADPGHQEVGEYVGSMAHRLGPYAPEAAVTTELHRIDVDPASESAQVLLYLAGPYTRRARWFENTTTSGQRQAAAAVDAVFGRCPAPSTEALVQALTSLGMAADAAHEYIRNELALRQFGDVWVRWGDSTADRAEAVLHARGTPTTAEELFTAIGTDSASQRALRETLYADPRFVRASPQSWGLRTWGIDEYSGLVGEIVARIDAAGGKASIDKLIRDILSDFPDVAERSIRAYLSTLAFICEAGMVRRRADTDEWPLVPALDTAPGAFRNGNNEIRLAIPVTIDMLRGSGLQLRPAAAAALGVSPGQRRIFSSPHGQVVVSWRLSSTNGPSLGSLRLPATANGATLGDTLVVAFRLEESTLDVERIGAEVAGIEGLRLLLGRTVRKPAAALAASLNCRKAEVAAVLRRRGDDDLANLIED